MASFLGLFVVLIAMAAAGNIAAAASHEFKVGDSLGWTEPTSNGTDVYNQWASKKRFQVGDSLEFDYKNDSVLVVDKKGYYHCVASNPISSFSDGKTIYKLEKPGLIYFISGVPDHCKNGQRLIVDVMALHPSPHPGHHPDSADSPSPSPLPSSATMASSPTILLALATLVLLSSGSAMLQ
ncbi:hypothetical protein MRB53_012939 [Persea americana]|uniref:Uncharacterized protein n=1 Tax=Persea americana TaxID=3435 RepID=A0ACC2M0E5_PERAE|nr:hypothetical protein MRB53_012939 [Persea americana]